MYVIKNIHLDLFPEGLVVTAANEAEVAKLMRSVRRVDEHAAKILADSAEAQRQAEVAANFTRGAGS